MSYLTPRRYSHASNTVQVTPRKKSLPYSITPVKNLAEWKAEQGRLELEWQAKASERRMQSVERIESRSWENRPMTEDERAEVAYVASRQRRPDGTPSPLQDKSWVLAAEKTPPPKSMFRKIKDACLNGIARVWRNAFDPQ